MTAPTCQIVVPGITPRQGQGTGKVRWWLSNGPVFRISDGALVIFEPEEEPLVNGVATLNLPQSSAYSPTAQYVIAIPGPYGAQWTGLAPDLAGPLTLEDLKNDHNWGLVQTNGLPTIETIVGSKGDQGEPGPTGTSLPATFTTRGGVRASTYWLADYTDLPAALAAIGSASATLMIHQVVTVAASITVPAGVTLQFSNGGRLDTASGQVTTIAGLIAAPPVQIFGGAGSVSLDRANNHRVWVEWWGAKADADGTPGTGTDNYAPIMAAINAAQSASNTCNPLQIAHAGSYYRISAPITILDTPGAANRNNLTLLGSQPRQGQGQSGKGTVYYCDYATTPLTLPPLQEPVATATTGGNLSPGTYVYVVTYVTAGGLETVAGPPSQLVLCQTVNNTLSTHLSHIPLSADASIVARKIYRGKVNTASPLWLCATLSDNSTTTFDDSMSDATLMTGPQYTMPAGVGIILHSSHCQITGIRVVPVNGKSLYCAVDIDSDTATGAILATHNTLRYVGAYQSTYFPQAGGSVLTHGVQIGYASLAETDYMNFEECRFGAMGADVYIPSKNANTFSHLFRSCWFGASRWSVRSAQGNYNLEYCSFQTPTYSCLYVTNPDSYVNMLGCESESIQQLALFQPQGQTSGAMPLGLKSCRFTPFVCGQVQPPVAPTPVLGSITGGSVAAGARTLACTFLTANGQTTIGTAYAIPTGTITAPSRFTVFFPLPRQAETITGINLYAGLAGVTAPTRAQYFLVNQSGPLDPTIATYTMNIDDTTLAGGANPPSTNTATYTPGTNQEWIRTNGTGPIVLESVRMSDGPMTPGFLIAGAGIAAGCTLTAISCLFPNLAPFHSSLTGQIVSLNNIGYGPTITAIPDQLNANVVVPPSTKSLQFTDFLLSSVISGFALTSATNSYAVTVGTGTAYIATGTNAGKATMAGSATPTLPASSDNYLDFDGTTVQVTSVANGGAVPALASGAVRVWKLVTDGSGVASTVDTRVPNLYNFSRLTKTAAYGYLNLGGGTFGGVAANGDFFGNSSGQVVAINNSSGTQSDFLHFQTAGVDRLVNDFHGNLTIAGGLAVHGATSTTKPTISGACAGNTAIKNLLTALATMGFLTDSTTA